MEASRNVPIEASTVTATPSSGTHNDAQAQNHARELNASEHLGEPESGSHIHRKADSKQPVQPVEDLDDLQLERLAFEAAERAVNEAKAREAAMEFARREAQAAEVSVDPLVCLSVCFSVCGTALRRRGKCGSCCL